MQDPENKVDTANAASENQGASEPSKTYEPTIRIAVPGRPDTVIRMEGVPASWLSALEGPKRSPWGFIFKDIAPGLTSLAAVLLSLAALIYTNHQKNAADTLAKEQREKAADAAQKKFQTDLIGNFGRLPVPAAESDDKRIVAMKVAVYGEQALPAVRMALGSSDDSLRFGGETVVEQMYLAETVPHQEITQKILSYYPKGSEVLRRGVLEWLGIMGNELQEDDREFALTTLLDAFGTHAQICRQKDQELARAGGHVLVAWSLVVSGEFRDRTKELALGMVENCPDDSARTEALNALVAMTKSLSQEEKQSIVVRLKNCEASSSSSLRPIIDNAITELQKRNAH
jgi:hypothetical protein